MSQQRTRARQRAVQAIYQWQMTGQGLSDIKRQFMEDQQMDSIDLEYFEELLRKVPANLDVLDSALLPLLDRSLAELDPIERAILRIGAYELHFRPDVPYRVVIYESVALARKYGAESSHKYINGVLDGLARETRSLEIN